MANSLSYMIRILTPAHFSEFPNTLTPLLPQLLRRVRSYSDNCEHNFYAVQCTREKGRREERNYKESFSSLCWCYSIFSATWTILYAQHSKWKLWKGESEATQDRKSTVSVICPPFYIFSLSAKPKISLLAAASNMLYRCHTLPQFNQNLFFSIALNFPMFLRFLFFLLSINSYKKFTIS